MDSRPGVVNFHWPPGGHEKWSGVLARSAADYFGFCLRHCGMWRSGEKWRDRGTPFFIFPLGKREVERFVPSWQKASTAACRKGNHGDHRCDSAILNSPELRILLRNATRFGYLRGGGGGERIDGPLPGLLGDFFVKKRKSWGGSDADGRTSHRCGCPRRLMLIYGNCQVSFLLGNSWTQSSDCKLMQAEDFWSVQVKKFIELIYWIAGWLNLLKY